MKNKEMLTRLNFKNLQQMNFKLHKRIEELESQLTKAK
jgi:hypothetical protein